MPRADDNIVPFERPQPREPDLEFVEVRLEGDCSLVLTVVDAAGNRFALDYPLGFAPPGFDLDRLRAAWQRWRGSSTAAS